MQHNSDAAVLVCLDWRLFQTNKILNQIKETAKISDFDLISLAGATKNIVDEASRELGALTNRLMQRHHHSKKVILTNHTDCGAYGPTGTEEKLIADLKKGKDIILEKFPDSEVLLILIRVSAGESCWQTSCEAIS